METFALYVTIAIALGFDFVNGFHDAANSIATVVSTRVLSPRLAVVWAAFFNFAAFLIFGTVVAATIATGVVEPEALTIGVIFAGLIGAIVWNLITWWLGLPSSSSHALIGGLLGATIAAVGTGAIKVQGVIDKVLIPLVSSPVIGFVGALLLIVGIALCVLGVRRRPTTPSR